MQSLYLVIDAETAAQNGYTREENVFVCRLDVFGRWVCAVRSRDEFPELFPLAHYEEVTLSVDDFPEPQALSL